jgi:hypothetical protein
MGGGRVEGSSPQWHLHGSGAQPVGKRQHWTGGGVEVLRNWLMSSEVLGRSCCRGRQGQRMVD